MSLVTLHPPVLAAAQPAPRHPWKDEVNCRLSRIFVVVVHFLISPCRLGFVGLLGACGFSVHGQSLRSSLRENTDGSVEALVESFSLFLLSGWYHLLHLPTNYFTLSYLLATSTTGNLRLDLAAAATTERPRQRWYRPLVDRGVTGSKPSFFFPSCSWMSSFNISPM